MPEFDPSSAVLDDFDPQTASPEDDFDPSSAMPEESVKDDPFTPRAQAELFNTFQDAMRMDRDVLGAIRQNERGQQMVQQESAVAGLMMDLQREGLNPALKDGRIIPGTSKPLTPQQAEKLNQINAIRSQLPLVQDAEADRLAESKDGNRTPLIQRLFGDTMAAQVDKEFNQGVKDSSGSVAGGALGARMMMGARGGPIGMLLPIAGAIGGSMVGGAVQEEATAALENNAEVTAQRRERMAQLSQDPNYKAGSIAAMGAMFRPSLTTIRGALGGNPEALANIGLGGALGAGTAAIHPMMEGRAPTMGELAEGGALGLAFHQPTRLAQGLFGFHPFEIQANPATQTARTPIGTIDPSGRVVEPATPEGVALRSVAGLDATTPTELQPSQDAQNLLDVIAARHTTPEGTDWTKVRETLKALQPSQSNNPEFLRVMDESLQMAEQRSPSPIEQEVAPDLAPVRPAVIKSHNDLRSAIKVGDEVIVGNPGEEHADILKRMDPEVADSVSVSDIAYADATTGKFLSEAEAVKALPEFGMTHAEIAEAGRRLPGEYESIRGGMASEELVRAQRSRNESKPKPETQGLPPEYSRAAELPPREAARELNLPESEVVRRKALVDEVQSGKYSDDPLASPEIRKFKDLERPEGGGIFGGGSRPKPKPIGGPPSGDSNWIEVAPWYKRRGFEREGASPILQTRQKNAIGKQLGRATDRQFDVETDLVGRMSKDLDRGIKGMPKAAQKQAFDELSLYIREKENGRTTPSLSTNAQKLLNSWQDIAEFTGLLAQSKGVKVSDAGGYRPMRLIGRDYLPRMIAPEVARAIRDPQRHTALFNRLVGDLATQKSITPEAAALELNAMAGGKGRVGVNDFMGNIEVARGDRLPESFYEYDLRKIIPHYVNRYAKRMGQIIAYGQRLGSDTNPSQKNLWDYARDEVRGGDKTTAQWVNEAEAQSRNERQLSGVQKLGQRLQTSMTGLLLGNPTSTVPRNLLSGLQNTAELLGYARTVASSRKVFDAAERVGAKEMGIVRDDLASLLHAEQLPDDSVVDRGIRAVTDTLLSVSGYNASETFVRTTNMLAASSFARDAAKAIQMRPNSRFAKQAMGLIQRMGINPSKLAIENGEWKTGPETQKFIRQVINQSQGGYKFNQVPLWAGTPAGRFFYQFGRWGTQRANNLWKNVLKPAIEGDQVMVHGTPMVVRDFKPLARVAVGTVALGEAFAGLGKLFFDRDRKDASMTEIGVAMKEDQKKAAMMIGSRLVNDIIMGGSMGIWGQPLDVAVAAKDGSRLKNPAEPPGLGGIKGLMQFGLDVVDQGEATGDDVKRLMQSIAPGPVAVTDMTRNIFDDPKYEAENDVRTLRNAGIRFGQENKMDVAWRGGGSDQRKTDRVPVFSGIRDALLVGDTVSAKKIRADYLQSLKPADRLKAERAIKSSVKARQPFRVGPFNSDDVKQDFMAWARKNLSPEDLNQITRTQGRYEQAAKAAGMW